MLALESTDHIYKRTDVQHHQWLIRSLPSKSAGDSLLLICWSVYSLRTELLMVLPLFLLVGERHCKLLALLLSYAPDSLGLLNENVKTCVFTIKHNFIDQPVDRFISAFNGLLVGYWCHDWRSCNFCSWVWKKWEASWQKAVICSVAETYYTANSHGIQIEHELSCIWPWEGCCCCWRGSGQAARGTSRRWASQYKWASDCDENGMDVPEVDGSHNFTIRKFLEIFQNIW